MDEETSHSLLETQLIDAINDSLAHHIYSNATFLAERLLAEKDNEQSRGLLADCYMAESKFYKVVVILKDCKTDANRYKFALSCMKITKFKEGEKALLGAEALKPQKDRDYSVVPNGSYGLYLLGCITEKDNKCNDAKLYYQKALEINPTLWCAYERLGKLGENTLPSKVFTDTKMKGYQNSVRRPGNTQTITRRSAKQDNQVQPRSHTTTTNVIRRRNSVHSAQPSFPNLMALLKKLAEGNYNLIMYNCLQAIEEFKKLPQNHFNTGWVLCNIGKAYMEIVKYQEAIQYYDMAYKLQPHRIQGVDYYSSCLWHLKKHVELTNLAHQSLQKTLYAPEAWIAVGNCFSLQKEHEQALKFFTRAIQLSPNNTYALSLCGHEYVYNEDFPKARKMFQSALSYDVRHYNAWWGLGNIFYKQEKYDKAAESFDKAIGINSKNPVLYSFMGITLAASRQFTKALTYFEKSQKLDPKNGLNRFQKANTLVKLERHEDAVRQLQNMLMILPKEPQIPTLLGKIYKKLNKIERAHYYFSLALDLESKDAQKIKGFIESLHTQNENEEMEI